MHRRNVLNYLEISFVQGLPYADDATNFIACYKINDVDQWCWWFWWLWKYDDLKKLSYAKRTIFNSGRCQLWFNCQLLLWHTWLHLQRGVFINHDDYDDDVNRGVFINHDDFDDDCNRGAYFWLKSSWQWL